MLMEINELEHNVGRWSIPQRGSYGKIYDRKKKEEHIDIDL